MQFLQLIRMALPPFFIYNYTVQQVQYTQMLISPSCTCISSWLLDLAFFHNVLIGCILHNHLHEALQTETPQYSAKFKQSLCLYMYFCILRHLSLTSVSKCTPPATVSLMSLSCYRFLKILYLIGLTAWLMPSDKCNLTTTETTGLSFHC